MPFRSVLNFLWEIIISPFFLPEVTTTPLPPSIPSNTPVPPPRRGRYMGCDTTNNKFSSVDFPGLSNLSAAESVPGAYHLDPSTRSPSSIGCLGHGSRAPLAGHPGLAGVAPSTNSNFSALEPPNCARPAKFAPPRGYPSSPSLACSGFGYLSPSTNSIYSSSPPISPPSSLSPSRFSTGPAASASLSSTQDNGNLQSSSKWGCNFDTQEAKIPEAPPCNPEFSEFVQDRALRKHILKLRRRLLFLKSRKLRQGPSDTLMEYIAATEHLLNSELRTGKIIEENERVSCARKRALELEADLEVCAAEDVTGMELGHIPPRKKTRVGAKCSRWNATAGAPAPARGNTEVPPKMPSGTQSARTAAQAESSGSHPSPPPPDPITPVKIEIPVPRDLRFPPRTALRRKRPQEGPIATGPKHKRLKSHCVGQHKKTSKGKSPQAANSGERPRRTKVVLGPSSSQWAGYLPRPVEPRNFFTSMEEVVDGYNAVPVCRARLARGASVAPLGRAIPLRKRKSENIIVKSATTKRLRKEYFLPGMVLEYESDDDTETVDEKRDTTEARPATPLTAYTFIASTTAPTKMVKRKLPLPSTLGKRTSAETKNFETRDTGDKKGRKEYFQEGMILDDESDGEPMTNHNDHEKFSTGWGVDCDYASYCPPWISPRGQSLFATRVEDALEE